MAININLTDNELRTSPEFIDFLIRYVESDFGNSDWFDQISESLKPNNTAIKESVRDLHGTKITNKLIEQGIQNSYQLTIALLIGDMELIKAVHANFKYEFLVGIPRSGGSYLTKQLFRSLGMDPERVPGILAHDGFPKAWPFDLKQGDNSYTMMIRYIAEYIVMSTLFFGNNARMDGRVLIPKKDVNAAYHGALYRKIYGEHSSFIVTIRNPASCCISTYEKSGGYPADGRYKNRSNIELFMKRDALSGKQFDPETTDYFEIYLKYWEYYYINLAVSGLFASNNVTVIPYNANSMTGIARTFYEKHNSELEVEEFKVFDKRQRHPQWFERAEASMNKIARVWDGAGYEFPMKELLEAW